MREVGRRNALVYAPSEHIRQVRALAACEAGVEERLQAVERQVKRVQDEIRCLVVGRSGAVAEGKLRFAEAAHGVAEPVPDGFELRGRVHRAISSRSRIRA